MTFAGQKILDLFILSLDAINPKTKIRILKERDAEILKYCYDFENLTFMEFIDVAKEYHLTRERVRQIHYQSLIKIRNAGRNPIGISPCNQLINYIDKCINEIQDDNKYNKVITFWNSNLPEIPSYQTVLLISHLLYKNNHDISKNLKELQRWHSQIKIDVQNTTSKLRKEEILKERCLKGQENLLNQIIWFSNKRICSHNDITSMTPQRMVRDHKISKSGKFFSAKCNKEVQYESGLELNFIKLLENYPRVTHYVEQPVLIEYSRHYKDQKYTPDFAVFLDSGEGFIVEIKDFLGMVDSRVQRKIEAAIDYCKAHGFGILLTNGEHSIQKLFDQDYNLEFEKELLSRLDQKNRSVMFYNEFKELQEKHCAKWLDLLPIVLKNNLSLYPYPFKLCRENNYKIFRNTMIKNG